MDLRLSGKRALVTGASSGIGTAIAQTLAAEGASVIVHGRNAERTKQAADSIRATGGAAQYVLGDLANDAGALSVAQAADEAFGGVDILINNAGGPTDVAHGMGFFDLSAAHWKDTYERNVTSALLLAKHFAPQMQERRWGRIIQISSGLAYSPRGIQGDYTASKAALNNFTFNLSRALANTGVTVNGISPGMTVTPTLQSWLTGMAEANGLGADAKKGEEFVLKNLVHLTVNRLGLPQDIANVAAFLSSPGADYINGTTVRVDGGGSPSVN